MIVTSTAVFSPPDSWQQPHFHAQSNVHQCNNALQKTQHQNPETTETRNAQFALRKKKTGNNRRETQRERGGESSRAPFDIKLDGEMENRKNKKEIKRAKNSHENGPLSPHPQTPPP